jgi:methylmalonyl-CoA mutase
MRNNTIEGILENFFSKSTRSDWKKIAMQETNGKDPFEILAWRGKDNFFFLPYYDAQDVANLQYLNDFQLPAANNVPYARQWLSLPAIVATDEAHANNLALKYLTAGANGVLFDLKNLHHTDFNSLLQEIQWPHCFLAFQMNGQSALVNGLADFILEKYNPASVSAALFWESIPKKSNFDLYFNCCPNFRAVGLIIRSATPAAEIADALFKGVQSFESLSSSAAPANIFRSICFSVPADVVLVESIAKLKVLRMLWYQIAHAYGLTDYKLGDLHIHCRAELVGDAAYGPHENMLNGTFASMAAIMGGCNSITVESSQAPPFIPRWAKNVSLILQEESFFDRVADPLAGSYALNVIIDKMAATAWEMFQIKCRS